MEFKLKAADPRAWKYRDWKLFFLVAALWNFSGSVPGAIWPDWSFKLFYGAQACGYYTVFLNRAFWLAVLFFGIGYAIISLDPKQHWGIMVMGIIGKLVVAGNWVYLYSNDKATFLAVFAALGDTTFTAYFVYCLLALAFGGLGSGDEQWQ